VSHLLRIQTSHRICVLLSDYLMCFQCVPLVHRPLLESSLGTNKRSLPLNSV
jgi:hypothetical protein